MNEFEILEDPNEFIDDLKWNDKLAIAISYTKVRNDRSLFSSSFCFDNFNSIYGYSLKFLMRKDFALINELNEFILRATDSGLINKWLKGKRFETLKEKPQQFRNISIGISSIIVLLFICTGMLVFALSIFIIERIVHKKIQVKNTGFFKYVDMTIDSNRYFLLDTYIRKED